MKKNTLWQKATWGRKGLFFCTIPDCIPSLQECQSDRSSRQLVIWYRQTRTQVLQVCYSVKFFLLICKPQIREGYRSASMVGLPKAIKSIKAVFIKYGTCQLDLKNLWLGFSSWVFLGCVKLAEKISFIFYTCNPPSGDLLPPPLSYTYRFSFSFISYFYKLQYLECMWMDSCDIYNLRWKKCFLSKSKRKICRVWNDNKNSCFDSQSPCSEI